MRKVIFTLICFFTLENNFAQSAASIFKLASDQFSSVNNFKSDVNIDFNIPSINMEKISGKIFFKMPNKFKVKLKGIAFLPKQNPFELYNFIKDPSAYVAVMNGSETVDGKKCFVVTALPLKEQDLILIKCWICPDTKCILKSQLTTKSSGTVTSDYFYTNQIRYALPDKIIFSIELTKFKLPKMVSVDINSKTKQQKDASNKTTGTITFNFSRYEINKGVKEEDFKNGNQ